MNELVEWTDELSALKTRITTEISEMESHVQIAAQHMWNAGQLLVAANPHVEYNAHRMEDVPIVPMGQWQDYLKQVLGGRSIRTGQRWMRFFFENSAGCPKIGDRTVKMIGETTLPVETDEEPSTEEMLEELQANAPQPIMDRINRRESNIQNEYAIYKCLPDLTEDVAKALVQHGIGDYKAIPLVQSMATNMPEIFKRTIATGNVGIYDRRGDQLLTIPLRQANRDQISNCYTAEIKGTNVVTSMENMPLRHLDTAAKLEAVGEDEGVCALYLLIPGVSDGDREHLKEIAGRYFRIALDDLPPR